MLAHLDIVHFKFIGRRKLLEGFNKMQAGIYIELHEVGFIVTVENKKVVLIPFLSFANKYGYVSSRAKWIEDPTVDILSRIGMNYNKQENFVLEILGAMNTNQNVMEYCIEKKWLSA